MHHLREIEEQIMEYGWNNRASHLSERDLEVLEQIEREQSGAFKKRLATLLVELGIKVHPSAAIRYAASHEAA
jgi:hypothetical protein